MYAIYVGSGEYYQSRGGFDWGRADLFDCTKFDTVVAGRREAARCQLSAFRIHDVDEAFVGGEAVEVAN